MDIFKKGGIIRGKIKNLETGELTDISRYLLDTGFTMNTIIKITNIESYTHPDNSNQICVECLALDSCGSVFKLDIDFIPKDHGEMSKIINYLNNNLYVYIEGEYSIIQNEHRVTMYNPKYSSLPEEFVEVEVEKAFMFNS